MCVKGPSLWKASPCSRTTRRKPAREIHVRKIVEPLIQLWGWSPPLPVLATRKVSGFNLAAWLGLDTMTVERILDEVSHSSVLLKMNMTRSALILLHTSFN